MNQLLEGKTALITGATRGIGKGIAEKLASQGANIAFTYSSSVSAAEALEAELSKTYNVKVKGYKSDAAVLEQANELIENVGKDFGDFEILINNAGITKDNLLMRMTEDQWDDVINVNLKSVFNLTKASVRNFLKLKRGSIINMSSVVGVTGNAGQSNYSASKAGIIGFSKSVAKELGSRNIRCNVVTPGFDTNRNDRAIGRRCDESPGWIKFALKRGGTTEDVANLCLFLGSDMSTYITGQVLSVCGGMVM